MTAHVAPISLDFEEGIDRKTLRRLRDRFLLVNQQRWNRAHSALSYRQQMVLEILPLVFHLNHPALPGYLDSDCPYGLSNYQPSPATINAARRLARTFSLKDEGKRKPDLDAMFLMGSPGTLGHSVASDLDVWLCHRSDLPERGIRCLERKAAKLARWAESFGVELHVFVFCASDWRAGRQRVEVTGENCGSAQHFLLLDEFYRTSIHLAGAWPMWWLIPAEREETYDDCMRRLVDYRFVRAEDYIDFGPVPAIPEEEFLGAGVWQLYKGIDAPWKSILKLLLIECYARTTGEALLSIQFKRAVFRGETDADRHPAPPVHGLAQEDDGAQGDEDRAGEAQRQQDHVAGHGVGAVRHLLEHDPLGTVDHLDVHGVERLHPPLADEALRHHRECPLAAFLLGAGRAKDQRPLGPGVAVQAVLRWRREQLDLSHRGGTLAQRRAQAVRPGVAAAQGVHPAMPHRQAVAGRQGRLNPFTGYHGAMVREPGRRENRKGSAAAHLIFAVGAGRATGPAPERMVEIGDVGKTQIISQN